MKWITLLLLFSTFLAANAWSPFLDCGGNRPFWPWQRVMRKCCSSRELPNGCECFHKKGFAKTFLRPHVKCPSSIGVGFYLYTRENKHSADRIRSYDSSLKSSHFKGTLPIKFITHGFSDKGPRDWSLEMKNELLKQENMNVIIVDWQRGAKAPNYWRACSNVRVVGAVIGQLIYVMKARHGADMKKIHLIGHSLGAHVSGTAAKEASRLVGRKVGRISGLDPAALNFEKSSRWVRLDRRDALFVDVMHTDAEPLLKGGLGIRKRIGHVDFFPNGGVHQPGCPKERFGILSASVSCSHSRATDYFTSSINKCAFLPPNKDPKCKMGYHTQTSCTGRHDTKTTSKSPFCYSLKKDAKYSISKLSA